MRFLPLDVDMLKIGRLLLLLIGLAVVPLLANANDELVIPNFWDRNERFVKPDLSGVPRLKFLTTTDFPPFNFIDRKKRLSGFHVDLARAICVELELLNRCQIQAVPWDELEKELFDGNGDALIAGLVVDVDTRQRFVFSRPYMHVPGRFVTRLESGMVLPVYEALFRRTTGVVEGSAHAAYFAEIFSTRQSRSYPTREESLEALKNGEVDAVFSDALSLSFWLTSPASQECCSFLGGAFSSSTYFGNGMAVAFRPDQTDLAKGVNYALSQINEKGIFAELYLRYFPKGLY